jgi:hypothetical protein
MVTIGIERLHGILVGADIGLCGFRRKSWALPKLPESPRRCEARSESS